MSGILLDQADRLFGQFVTREVLGAADRGIWPDALWAAIEEAGLPLALVSEDNGGAGLGAGDAARLVRRSAFHTAPVPLAETMLANALWSKAGGEAMAGPLTVAPTNARDVVEIVTGPDGTATLTGTARRVPWGAQASHILVLARSRAAVACLCLVRGGAASATPIRNLANEPRDTLIFDGVIVPDDLIRPAPPEAAAGLMALGAALRVQQMAGAMERCLGHALLYANERVQFGRPIARFQAIQHMLALAAGHLAASAAAADSLIEADGTPGFALASAIAKARVGEAAGQVAAISHQVHAAMGFTQEHPLHFASRRLWSWRDEFGSDAYWQERIGQLVCGHGGDALWPLVTGETSP